MVVQYVDPAWSMKTPDLFRWEFFSLEKLSNTGTTPKVVIFQNCYFLLISKEFNKGLYDKKLNCRRYNVLIQLNNLILDEH